MQGSFRKTLCKPFWKILARESLPSPVASRSRTKLLRNRLSESDRRTASRLWERCGAPHPGKYHGFFSMV
jgi:hypothetical protein